MGVKSFLLSTDVKLMLIVIVFGGLLFLINFKIDYEIESFKNEIGVFGKVFDENLKGLRHAQMYDTNLGFYANVFGVYFPGKEYYCVWTGNQTEEEIKNSVEHESCHDFVWKFPEHFCENACKKMVCEGLISCGE